MDGDLQSDLRTLAEFIGIYCARKHSNAQRTAVELKTHDVHAIVGDTVRLCEECEKLLTHAFVKRSTCPFDPKPACKRCPDHCYHPDYRQRIKEVMKYSGRRLVLSGRLDYLFELLF